MLDGLGGTMPARPEHGSDGDVVRPTAEPGDRTVKARRARLGFTLVAVGGLIIATWGLLRAEPYEIRHGLVEACIGIRDGGPFVVSPGMLRVFDDGRHVVEVPGRVLEGPETALIGTGVVRAGTGAGGITPAEEVEFELGVVELDGPGTWPVAVVVDPRVAATIAVPQVEGTDFTVTIVPDC